MLSAVGYSGFRWATQIDPIWNAYFLGLVLSIAEQIEAARILANRQVVFSYRYQWDEESGSLFARDSGWLQFQKRSADLAREFNYVVSCDIADFYPRIYHHRLENALGLAIPKSQTPRKIVRLLKYFSKNVSYGLPVGGPAARLLSELLLNRVDRLLAVENIRFCRFADDYRIFSDSLEAAYTALLVLSGKLIENEGLLLQKSKTQVQTSVDYLSTVAGVVGENEQAAEAAPQQALFRLRLRFDPYSPTGAEDYETLKRELQRLDILGILGRELRKSRIDITLTKRLLSALRLLPPDQQHASIDALIDNLAILYPVFPVLALVLRDVLPAAPPEIAGRAFSRLRELVTSGSHIAKVQTNLAYLVRVLALDPAEEAEPVLQSVFNTSQAFTIRRDVILAMSKRKAFHWTSDRLKQFGASSQWERRALIATAGPLGDEARFWLRSARDTFSPVECLVRDWAQSKRVAEESWDVPL